MFVIPDVFIGTGETVIPFAEEVLLAFISGLSPSLGVNEPYQK